MTAKPATNVMASVADNATCTSAEGRARPWYGASYTRDEPTSGVADTSEEAVVAAIA